MNCPQCNELLPDGTKFCMNCGLKLGVTLPTHPTPVQGIPQSQPNAYQPNAQSMVPSNLSPQTPGLPIGQALSPLPGGIMPSYNQYQAEGGRNFLERIANKIPGYKGYLEKESRRDVDKLHREHLATLLFQLKSPIHTVIRELTDNRRLFEIGPIEKAIQKLEKVENRIRYASYGYAGFFDAVKIREDQLDQLYHFDLALVDEVENIKSYVQKLVSQAGDPKALKTAAQELTSAIDDLDAKFNQRYQAIENPGWSPF